MGNSIDNWNPTDAQGPASNVMPYTQGVSANTTNPGGESLVGSNTIPGFMANVPGNSDSGAKVGN